MWEGQSLLGMYYILGIWLILFFPPTVVHRTMDSSCLVEVYAYIERLYSQVDRNHHIPI